MLLLHGFASDARTNWVRTGVVDALVDGGFQVTMYDARGHGKSGIYCPVRNVRWQ